MKQLITSRAGMILGGIGALLIAGAANADRVAIDGSGETVTTICSAAAATTCSTPTPLKTSFAPSALVANFGFGPFSSVYIYNNGIVSIGVPIAVGANFSSLSTIGGNVFTAGYSPTMTLSNFTIQGPSPALAPFDGAGNPVVRVYYDAKFNGTTQQMEFNIFDLGSGNYELSLNHGNFNGDPIDFPDNAYLGYSFNGTTVQESGTALQAKVKANANFRYFFSASGGASNVPEPSAWAMLTLGFAAIGAALRRRSAGAVFAG